MYVCFLAEAICLVEWTWEHTAHTLPDSSEADEQKQVRAMEKCFILRCDDDGWSDVYINMLAQPFLSLTWNIYLSTACIL